MKPLPAAMTLSLGDGESATSFVSRMAVHLGRTAHEFCLDMGLKFQHVVDGHDETLHAVANLCRADGEQLKRNAIIREDNRLSLSGQVLTNETLEQAQVRVCPHCLAEDIREGGGEPEVRPYGRSAWRLSPIRTCVQHHSPLVNVRAKSDQYHLHDFALIVSRSIPRLGDLVDQATTRSPSGLELYLANRLSGDGPAFSWLDQLPFYAAAKACEVIGAVAEFGLKVQFLTLCEDDWYRAAATGFEFAAEGEAGIYTFLSSLRQRFFSSKDPWGPGRMFGRLYHWLAHESDDPAYELLRSLIRGFMIETMPVGPGDRIFGREITRRRFHSLLSASKVTGVRPDRLRNLLHAAGHISHDAMKLTPERTLIDAETTQEFLDAVADSMLLKHARLYINAPRRHDRMLVDSGFIQPLVGGDGEAAPDAFPREELDRFLTRLLDGAQVSDPSRGELAQIPVAAKRASCSPMRVVELILDRELSAYRLPAERGYLSAVVSVAELKRLLGDPQSELVPLKEVERMLKVRQTAVASLVEHGILPTQSVANRYNHVNQRMVAREDVQEFMDQYVSLYALARKRGIGFSRMRKILEDDEVVPAFDPEKVSTTFYERSIIAAFSAPGSRSSG